LTQAFGLPLAYPKATTRVEDITTLTAKAIAFRENSKGDHAQRLIDDGV
jgi:hypothetical protein